MKGRKEFICQSTTNGFLTVMKTASPLSKNFTKMKTAFLQDNGAAKAVSMKNVNTGINITKKGKNMKKIDEKICQLLLDKLQIIADWSFECEKNSIGDAIEDVIKQFYENMEQM